MTQGQGTLIENRKLHNLSGVFQDREDAGIQLAAELEPFGSQNPLLLAIPSGGVPVAKTVQKKLGCELDLLIVRKIQIPWETEAGFGAVNGDGDCLFNETLLRSLHLSESQIEEQVLATRSTIRQRNRLFRQGREFPAVGNRLVIVVDDGLASGYTMLAAIAALQRRDPQEIVVAVPTGSFDTVQRLLTEANTVCCLNVRERYPFAVAAAYRRWYDLEDHDVLALLE